jgi:pimeloyl-ACP methyl ester carboxylesterase
MTTFVFIPGAGGVTWYWHRVVRLLEEAQHESVAVDLPGDDEHAGLSAYADRVLEAIGTRNVVLVAQSLGGFTAPLVCARAPVRMLVLVNAMIPVPGDGWGVVGQHRIDRSPDRGGTVWWLQHRLRRRHLLPPPPLGRKIIWQASRSASACRRPSRLVSPGFMHLRGSLRPGRP